MTDTDMTIKLSVVLDPPCGLKDCKIEMAHRHEKTKAQVDGDYARGVRDAAEILNGRGFVSRINTRRQIIELLEKAGIRL